MLTYIILAALSVLVGVWVLSKGSKTETKPSETPTLEEEPMGYESGSYDSVPVEPTPVAISPKPKKKPASKNTAKNESLAKIEAKPKKAKKQKDA